MSSFQLVNGVLSPGLFSDNPAMPTFYRDEVGLSLVKVNEHSPTYRHHFYQLGHGELMINFSGEPLLPGVSGYRQLVIPKAGLGHGRSLTDPDGLAVSLTPVGESSVTDLGVVCGVHDPEVQEKFLLEGLGALRDGSAFRIGDTHLFVEEDPSAAYPTPSWRRGFNYLAVLVDDCLSAHRALVGAGAEPSLRPMLEGENCAFSWVRDPNGNWIEVAQYAEDSPGPLPHLDTVQDHWEDVVRWREEGVPI